MSQAAGILAIVFAVLWLGTLVHESGHALVALGTSGWLVSMAVVGISTLLLILTLVRWRQLARPV